MNKMYALAHGLRGFGSDTLRVRVEEVRDGHAWVVTADLSSAGVPLTLRESQIEWLDDDHVADGVRHASGLVTFGGQS